MSNKEVLELIIMGKKISIACPPKDKEGLIKAQVVKLILHQASLNGNAQQQQWKITFKYIIGSKNLDKLANEPVYNIID